MKNRSFVAVVVRGGLFLGLMILLAGAAHAQTLRLEAQLVWGTDAAASPNTNHHPVEVTLAKRLGEGPYRAWKHYFKVNGEVVEVPVGESKSGIVMSDKCTLDIKNLGTSRVEVKLHGKGKPVLIHTDTVTPNSLLILAGDAGDKTAWMVIIRKTKSPISKEEKTALK